MAEKKNNFYRNVGISLGFVIVAAIIIFALNGVSLSPSAPVSTPTSTQTPTLAPSATATATSAPTTPTILGKPSWVNVSGKISLQDKSTNIYFKSLLSGALYEAQVSYPKGVKTGDGYYSILLPNDDSYQVSIIFWFGFAGSIEAGTLNVNTYNDSIAQNWYQK